MKRSSQFIVVGILAFLSLALLNESKGQTLEGKYPLFIFSNAFQQPGEQAVSLAKQAEWLRHYGYAGIEYNDPATILAGKKIFAEEGVKIFTSYVSVTIDDAPFYDARWHDIIPHFANQDWIIWVNVRSQRFDPSDPAADERVVAILSELAATAQAHGIRIALYPHYGFLVETPSDAYRIAEKIDRPNVGVTFNLCHFLKTDDAQNIENSLRQILPKLFVVSVSGAEAGATRRMGWDQLIQPLGKGSFSVLEFVRMLKKLGYRGAIGQQCYGIELPPEQLLRESSRAWKVLTE
ncbi:sugar phosphate isomerase/epimerase family protein [Tunicatimonas pelagia]|uniref:sugar phosphate isomerase/epimerase family protein n=1 Tax=Tunicatimonas pelagia TaxID=931531 RepID=UPI00266566FE|nr:sugar phosphate isomerase/epimerase [Tunicatimonas pelagia]WKN44860.1 sugar phosphate isomerase/epimerase [Tunicatimonas pelagia]